MDQNKVTRKLRIVAEPLEDRLLFSATTDFVLLSDGPDDPDSLTLQANNTNLLDVLQLPDWLNENTEPSSALLITPDSGKTPPPREYFSGELIFVDSSVANSAELIDSLQLSKDNAPEVYVLDSQQDGIEQISLVLAQYSGVQGIHLVSHGNQGRVNLGASQLDNDSLTDYQAQLAAWGDALDANGDILIYGCNLTGDSSGEQLVNNLATITNADVAASNDATGHHSLAGDWQLETRTGTIETQTLNATQWQGLLAATTNDDAITVWHDEVITGNLFTGEGGSFIDADSFTGSGQLVSVEYNGVVYSSFDGSDNITINADNGTFVINRDGTYTFTTSYSASTVNNNTALDWEGAFNVYGFATGDAYEASADVLDLTFSNATADAAAEFDNGIGVMYAGSESDEIDNDGNTEALVIDLQANYGMATVTVSRLGDSPAEQANWEAYDSAGNQVGSGSVAGVGGGGASDFIEVFISDTSADFQYLVFTSANADTSYAVNQITFAANEPDDEVFIYNVQDSGDLAAGSAAGNFTISFVDDNNLATAFNAGIGSEGATASTGFLTDDADGVSGVVSYQWQRSVDGENWTNISGATASDYVLTAAEGGMYMRAQLNYVDDEGTLETVNSQVSVQVTNNGAGRALFSGSELEGEILSGFIYDQNGATGVINYQWQSSADGTNWSDISGATSSDFTLTATEVGQYVRLTADYTDDAANPESVQSVSSGIIGSSNSAGVIVLSGTASEDQNLNALVTDADGIAGVITYSWERSSDGSTWANIAGATTASYTLGDSDVAQFIRVTASYTDNAGYNETLVSSATTPVSNVNDTPTLSFSGTESEDQLLTASLSDDDGFTTVSYQWQRSSDGSTWTDIASATSSSYTLTDADVNNYVRITASYSDDQGTAESPASSASELIAGVNDLASLSFSGTETEDEILSANLADEDGFTVVNYQWQRSADGSTWTDIASATNANYTLTDSDVGNYVRVTATYTDNQGTAETPVSSASGLINGINDVSSVSVTGVETEDQTLSATVLDDDGFGVITYQWQRSTDGSTWSNIASATNADYTLSDADVGNFVRVTASYTDNQGTAETPVSSSSGAISGVNDTASISFSGSETEDQRLSVTVIDDDGFTAINFQWQRSTDGSTWTDIASATSANYILTDADVGNFVRVTASYTDNQGTAETPVSSASGLITGINDLASISFSGTETEDQILSATVVDDDGFDAITYQWQRSSDGSTWTDIATATNTNYTLTDADVGNFVRVTASYIDNQGTAETPVSSASGLITGINDLASISFSGTETEDQILSATVVDDDGFGAITYQWQRSSDGSTWTDIATATNTNYTLTDADVGNFVRVTASYTDNQGTAETPISSASGLISGINDLASISFSGTETEDQILSATVVDDDGFGAVAYQWQRSSDGSAWTDIATATNTNYTLTDADVGNFVRVTASYTDNQGTAETPISSASGLISGINDLASISFSGTETEDQILSATVVDNDGFGAVAYQWQRSSDGSAWTDIATATNANYTLADADVGNFVRVTASYIDNQGTSETPVSLASGVITGVNDTSSISLSGTESEDQILSATIIDDDGFGAVAYQWQRSTDGTTWVDIASATNANYTLTDVDVGAFVRITASYTDNQGTTETPVSSASGLIAGVNDSASISYSGTATEDQILSANIVDADGYSTVTYQWQRSSDGLTWADITNASNADYTLTDADVGNRVRITASFIDNQGTLETPVSASTPSVTGINDPATLTLSGVAQEDQLLNANVTDPDGFTAVSYSWQRSSDGVTWTTIAGANDASYGLEDADVNNFVRAQAIFTDNQGTLENVTSSATSIVTGINDAPQLLNALSNRVMLEDTPLSWQISNDTFYDPDGDALQLSVNLSSGDALPIWLTFDAATQTFTGLASNDADAGEFAITVNAMDNSGETISATFTLTVNAVNDAPTAMANAGHTVAEDTAPEQLSLAGVFNDEEDGDQLRYQIIGNSNPALLGNATINANGQLQLSYAANQNGTSTLTIEASDSQGASVAVAYAVQVTPVNDAPTATSIADVTLTGGMQQNTMVDLANIFTDLEDGNNLTYSVVANSNPNLISVASVDSGSQTINLAIAALPYGTGTVTVRATDADGAFVETSFNVNVLAAPVNIAPQEPNEPETPTAPPNSNNEAPEQEPEPETPAAEQPSQETPRSNTPVVDNNFFITIVNNLGDAPLDFRADNNDDYEPRETPRPQQTREYNDEQRPVANDSSLANLVALPGSYLSEKDIADFNDELHKLRLDMAKTLEEQQSSEAIYKGITISVTAGIVIWLLRAGSLLLTLFSLLPVWKGLDPLPVITNSERREQNKKQRKDKLEEDKKRKEVGYLFDKIRSSRR